MSLAAKVAVGHTDLYQSEQREREKRSENNGKLSEQEERPNERIEAQRSALEYDILMKPQKSLSRGNGRSSDDQNAAIVGQQQIHHKSAISATKLLLGHPNSAFVSVLKSPQGFFVTSSHDLPS